MTEQPALRNVTRAAFLTTKTVFHRQISILEKNLEELEKLPRPKGSVTEAAYKAAQSVLHTYIPPDSASDASFSRLFDTIRYEKNTLERNLKKGKDTWGWYDWYRLPRPVRAIFGALVSIVFIIPLFMLATGQKEVYAQTFFYQKPSLYSKKPSDYAKETQKTLEAMDEVPTPSF